MGTKSRLPDAEITRSLKSSTLSSVSSLIRTFWGLARAAVKITWFLRETGYSALEDDPRISSNYKKAAAVS